MAGYDDTRKKIIDTLMGRPNGTEIQPENHQDYALNMLNYIRSLELALTSTLVGIADEDTSPIQPDMSNVCYLAGVAQERTVTFQNFRDYQGQPISITTGEMQAYFVILLWNKQYWSMQALPTTIVSHAENAYFYYRYNIRQTYSSLEAMEADKSNPVGIDGRYIKQGEIVSVVNNSDTSKNGFYSYTGSGWQFQAGFNFQIENSFGDDVNNGISQDFFTRQVQGRTILPIDISELNTLGNNADFTGYGIYKVITKDEVGNTASIHGLLEVIAEGTNKVYTQRYYTHDLLNDAGDGFSGTDLNTAYVYERSYSRDTEQWAPWRNIIVDDFGTSATEPISQKFFTEQVQNRTLVLVTVEDESDINDIIEQGIYKINVIVYGTVRNSYLLFVSHDSSSTEIVTSQQVKIDEGDIYIRTGTVAKDKTVSWKQWNNMLFKNETLSENEYDALTYKDNDTFYFTFEDE